MITLSEGSPYEILHDYISVAVAPYFKSYVKESGKADREGDKVSYLKLFYLEPMY